MTWHNGGTGGFTAFLGIDRERQTGVVILSARSGAAEHHHPGRFRAAGRIGDCA